MKALRIKSRAARVAYGGVALTSFEVRSMPLDDLFLPVRAVPAFASSVRDSVVADGLKNPVIVIRAPREDLVRWYQDIGWPHELLPDQAVLNVVCGGTNRVTVARELGYTHVDCVLVPDPYLAMRMQAKQRESHEPRSEEN